MSSTYKDKIMEPIFERLIYTQWSSSMSQTWLDSIEFISSYIALIHSLDVGPKRAF